jgi:predicted ATPase
MFLSRIKIANFKSLKDVEINSEGLVALVGPNGSGKTNFALAMKFLSEVHQHGLETAIARAGGFENIAYRKGKRTTSPIEFEVEVRFDVERERPKGVFPSHALDEISFTEPFVACHSFAFKACGGGIRAEFVVAKETLRLEVGAKPKVAGLSDNTPAGFICTITRNQEGAMEMQFEGPLTGLPDRYRARWNWLLGKAGRRAVTVGKQKLLIASPDHRDAFMRRFSDSLAQLGVFHFSSDKMRDSGTPTPNPALTMPGGNLPALVDWHQRKHPKTWAGILDAMRDIMPGLRSIKAEYLPSKTLGLYFEEEGFGRSWSVDEVSDGTIHALSMLVAAADPRISALVIEEPESSLHPWVIYELSKKLRDLSKDMTIFLTTHSPALIDTLKPSETWIVSRVKGRTEIRRLTEIDPQIEKDWSEGKVGLSEYLDSGLVPRAVPGGGL